MVLMAALELNFNSLMSCNNAKTGDLALAEQEEQHREVLQQATGLAVHPLYSFVLLECA